MALVIADRVKETTTTTGTGTINLAGAVAAFQTFVDGVGNGNTCYYAITSGNNWEIGLGTVTDASPDTLSRTTILASSNSDSAITLSGTSTVFATYPGPKSVHLDASGNLSHTVDISSDTNLAGGTNITLSGDTLNVDDAFLVNDASDTTTGTITAGGFTTTGTWTFDESTSGTIGITTIQDSGSSFSDNDTSLMTSAAIDDRINTAVAGEDTLAELNDTNISGLAAGHVLVYDNSASVWDNVAVTAGANITVTNGDGAITVAATDTNTTYTGGTNLTLAGTTFNVDDAFLKNDASDTTTGTITAAGFTTTGTWTMDTSAGGTAGITNINITDAFTDDDVTIMSAGAIKEKIEDYGYTTNTGDITGVDLTGGTGISIDSETNTTSGDYSSTITCNLEGTELKSTGETGGSKFLREDGDGTCSWQTVSGGGVSDIDDLGDVSFGGTNLTGTLLVNNAAGSAPTHGTLAGDCQHNIAIGLNAFSVFTNSGRNIALGYEAHRYAYTSSSNVAIGSEALRGNSDGTTTTGCVANVAIGFQAGQYITTGDYNTFLGYWAGRDITSGSDNIGIGQQALEEIEDGIENIAIGAFAGDSITSGDTNTLIGKLAGASLTTQNYNIAIGHRAGTANTTASMLFIGNGSEALNGTLIKGDMANKFLAIGKADVTLATEDATLQVYPTATNDSAYFAKMPGSHTGDLIRIENSSGTALFKVDKDGDLTATSITASVTTPYTTITGDTTVTTSNEVVFANATSGAIDVTLYLAASNGGKTLTIKKTDSSANAVSILRAGSETIDGATSVILYHQNESVTLISDNSNWFIV